jgi:transcriptional regulator with XRE-family HTH domain
VGQITLKQVPRHGGNYMNNSKDTSESRNSTRGSILRKIRREKKLKLRDLAGLVHMAESTLSKIETNDPSYHPSDDAIKRIVTALGFTFEALELMTKFDNTTLCIGFNKDIDKAVRDSLSKIPNQPLSQKESNREVIFNLRQGDYPLGLIVAQKEKDYSEIEFCKIGTLLDETHIVILRKQMEQLRSRTDIKYFFIDLFAQLQNDEKWNDQGGIFYPEWVLS